MKISQTSTVDRVYSWWYMEKYDGYPPPYVNLCPYLRAVLLWAPLRYLFLHKFPWIRAPLIGGSLGVFESIGWAEFVYLLWSTHSGRQLTFWPSMFLFSWIAAHTLALAISVAWLSDTYKLGKTAPIRFVKEVTGLIATRAHAAHESICPMIERGG